MRLTYVENPGAFLGLGSRLPDGARTWLLGVLSAALVIGVTTAALRSPTAGRGDVLALALVAAGGASNLIDRIAFGSVSDFVNVGVGALRTGIFNGADVAISAGVVWMTLNLARSGRR